MEIDTLCDIPLGINVSNDDDVWMNGLADPSMVQYAEEDGCQNHAYHSLSDLLFVNESTYDRLFRELEYFVGWNFDEIAVSQLYLRMHALCVAAELRPVVGVQCIFDRFGALVTDPLQIRMIERARTRVRQFRDNRRDDNDYVYNESHYYLGVLFEPNYYRHLLQFDNEWIWMHLSGSCLDVVFDLERHNLPPYHDDFYDSDSLPELMYPDANGNYIVGGAVHEVRNHMADAVVAYNAIMSSRPPSMAILSCYTCGGNHLARHCTGIVYPTNDIE